MANPWFRLYADILHNSKVQIVTEALRWRYVALLCLQCADQYENMPDDEVALSLRITLDEWLDTKKTFISRKLLHDDGSIYGWEKRQYISDLKDPTAAERQKRYREKNRNDRNDTVTSRLPEQIQNRTDTEQIYAEQARQVIEHLNKKTGSNFSFVDSNIKPIKQRIKETSLETVISVVDDRCKAWMNDQKMKEYLRPATLFNATKFASYAGSLGSNKKQDNWY